MLLHYHSNLTSSFQTFDVQHISLETSDPLGASTSDIGNVTTPQQTESSSGYFRLILPFAKSVFRP